VLVYFLDKVAILSSILEQLFLIMETFSVITPSN